MLENLNNKSFKLIKPYIDKKVLCDMGFKYIEENLFTYRFPVLKYRKIPTLFGIISVDSEGYVGLDCETPSGYRYSPFYNVEYGNYDTIISEINNSFIKEMRKLSIREIKKKKKLKRNVCINTNAQALIYG